METFQSSQKNHKHVCLSIPHFLVSRVYWIREIMQDGNKMPDLWKSRMLAYGWNHTCEKPQANKAHSLLCNKLNVHGQPFKLQFQPKCVVCIIFIVNLFSNSPDLHVYNRDHTYTHTHTHLLTPNTCQLCTNTALGNQVSRLGLQN